MSSFLSTAFFFALSLNICLGTFLMGFFLTVYNPVQSQLSHLYNWTDDSTKSLYSGLITAVLPCGAIIANFFSSKLIEYFGHKKTCLFIDVFCILSTILTLFSLLPLLLIGRLLCGFAVGVNSVLVGIYVKEITPLEHVDFFSSLGGLMLNFGMLTSFLFGTNTLSDEDLDKGHTDNYWRVMFGFPIVICAVRIILMVSFFNYDAPSFLIKKNKNEEALKTLNKLYNSDPKVQDLFNQIKDKVENKENSRIISYGELFKKKYFLRFLIGVSLAFGNQYSGVNAIGFYSKSLFTELGGSDSFANTLNEALGAVNLISGILIVIPLKKIGVRKTYLMSALGGSLMLGLVALFILLDIKIVSLICIFGYYFFFSLGIGPIIFMVIPQILPEKFVSVIFILMWFFSFIIGLTFPMMIKSQMNLDGSFLFFSCSCLTAFLFNLFYLPDTTGKTSEEVAALFDKKNKVKEDAAKQPFLSLNKDEKILEEESLNSSEVVSGDTNNNNTKDS